MRILDHVIRYAKKRSEDDRLQVGACVVVNGKFTFGTNRWYSLPEGMTREEVLKDRKLVNQTITHAEVDAITKAGDCRGGVIYSSYTPCDKCAKKIADAGIRLVIAPKMTEPGVIAKWQKYWDIGQAILRENGVKFEEQ